MRRVRGAEYVRAACGWGLTLNQSGWGELRRLAKAEEYGYAIDLLDKDGKAWAAAGSSTVEAFKPTDLKPKPPTTHPTSLTRSSNMAKMEERGWWMEATTVWPLAARPLSVDITWCGGEEVR